LIQAGCIGILICSVFRNKEISKQYVKNTEVFTGGKECQETMKKANPIGLLLY
jgi:hypothetical protein